MGNKTLSYSEAVAKFSDSKKSDSFKISEDGKTVTDISRSIKGALIIPEGIERVDFEGQYRNDKLTAFILPDSVEEIKGYFNGSYCENLEYVRLSPKLKSFPELFSFCKGISEIALPEGLKLIDYKAFRLPSIHRIELPQSLEYILPEALRSLDIEELTIPANVKVVCSFAFSYCRQLKKVKIESSSTVIMQEAFEGCDALEINPEILYQEHSSGAKIIGEEAVRYSEDGKKLEYVPDYYCGPFTIKDGTDSYYSGVFEHAYGITELNIPDSMNKDIPPLPPYATKVKFPEEVNLGNSLISREWMIIVSDKLEEFNIPKGITELKIERTLLKSINIPDWIEKLSLYKLEKLESITLPNSLKELKITGSQNLISLIVPEGTSTVELSDLENLEVLSLPDSLEKLEIQSLNKLNDLKVPDNVSEMSIKYCDSLKTFNIPSKLEVIEKEAFCRNESLEKIFIPNTVTKIEANAFEYCDNLKEIEIQGKPKPKISKTAFEGCPGWPIKK